MAVTINSKWYVSSVGWTAITAWAATTAMTVGMIRRQTAPAVGSERVFICVLAGTSLASEPTWVLTKGAKTTEAAGPVWMEITGLPGTNNDGGAVPLSSANRSGAQTLGNMIKNNTSTHLFICFTAGTTGAGEPTFNTTTGGTTTDSGCTWTCIGAISAFANWAGAAARLNNVLANTWAVGGPGTAVYVSDVHAETQTTTVTINRGATLATGVNWANVGIPVVCVPVGTIPPVAMSTGASVTASAAAAAINIDLTLDFYGIAFTCGTTSALGVGAGGNGQIRMFNCSLTGWKIVIGAATATQGRTELVNTSIAFNGTNLGFISLVGPLIWRDTPSALSLVGSGAWPTRLFDGNRSGAAIIRNVDLSAWAGATAMTGASNSGQFVTLDRCKIPATFPIITNLNTLNSPGDITVDLINCDNGGVTLRHEHWEYAGSQILSTNVYASGGASDGATPYAWRLATGTSASWNTPLKCPPLIVWNATTGANVTATVIGIYNGTALPTTDQIWIEATYLGTASSTLGVIESQTRTSPFDTSANQTTSTATWDAGSTARQNSHAYTLNEIVKVASNPGRIFICTSAGTSAGSEPGGYATAIDGGAVTDNTASFRAGVRFSMSLVLSTPQPQAAGYIYCRVYMGVLSSIIWVDPTVTLT